MADEFAEHLLVSSLAHMCKQQGWHQASRSGLSVFSDIARHYIRNIGILTLRYSLHGGRFEPDLDDLGNAFNELGIRLPDLQTFWSETEPNRGLPQVCSFPAQPTSHLNFPETSTNPDHVPDYLPSLTINQEPPVKDEEKVIKEESVTVTESMLERAVDPFDEAAAAPTPSAPNFPFVNKTDLPVPTMSSWGFQRITIEPKPSQTNNPISDNSEKQPHTSPDNFHINENSDDFVFASKHSKAKEEKLKEEKLKEEKLKEEKLKEEKLKEEKLKEEKLKEEKLKQEKLEKEKLKEEKLREEKLKEEKLKEEKSEEDKKVTSSEITTPKNESAISKDSSNESTLIENDSISEQTLLKPVEVQDSNHVENKSSSQESAGSDTPFLPSLGTSTPLVKTDKLPVAKNGQNGVTCKQQLFNHKPVENHTSAKEDGLISNSLNKSEPLIGPLNKSVVKNNVPDSDSEDFNDFGFDGSSSDEMTSKENVDRLLKPLSPLDNPISPVTSKLNKSPPSKRRKLDSPSSPPHLNSEKNLLKNRPDLIRNDVPTKPKSECKLVNNHNSHNKKPYHKPDKNHAIKKHEKQKCTDLLSKKPEKQKYTDLPKKPEKQKYTDLLKKSLNHGNRVQNRHKSKKQKKKEVPTSVDLFDDRPIKIPNHKTEKPKKISEKSNPVVVSKKAAAAKDPVSPNENITKLKIAPITLSLPKKDTEPIQKKEPPPKQSTQPVPIAVSNPEKTTSLKISIKPVKNSKIKSKSTIDSEDDLSSLSSDSLDGFADLLPKKSQKVKKIPEAKSEKRMFKTKAELKNPWPSSSSPSPSSASKIDQPAVISPPKVERKKQKSGGVTTKIKIGKSVVPQSPGVSLMSPKTSMKLKLPMPALSTENQELNSSVYSQPSLMIDETFVEKEEVKPPIPSLKIPKIKIKIGGASLNSPSSPASYSSSTVTSPEPPPPKSIKPLKIKLPDPSTLSIKTEPVTPKSVVPVKKKEKKPPKPKKQKSDPKPSKSSEKALQKEKPTAVVVKVEPEPVTETFDTAAPACVESTLVSETVVSETVAQTGAGGDTMKVWYCPSCMLPDDGSPMVGCDKCDEWYHWPCVGLVQAPPDNSDWFCPSCSKLRKSTNKGRKPGGKRKRKT